jgi:NADH-quinone oxidoreductase subunit N
VLSAAFATGATWLVVFAVMMSLVGAYYYLRIVKLMYFDDPVAAVPIAPQSTRTDARVLLAANGIALLVLGLVPDALMKACVQAMALSLAG